MKEHVLKQNVLYREYAATFRAKIWNYYTDLGMYETFLRWLPKSLFSLEL